MANDRIIETVVLLALPDRSRPRRRPTVFLFCHLEPSSSTALSATRGYPIPYRGTPLQNT
jgi:hypothetical protein